MKVQDVMRREVQTCLAGSKLSEALRKMGEHDCGAIPVVDADGKIEGILTDRDAALALGRMADRPASQVTAGEAMTRQVHTCAPADDLSAALKKMRVEGIHRLPVVETSGRTVGILSTHDFLFRMGPGPQGQLGISDEELVRTFRGIWYEQKAAKVAGVTGTPKAQKAQGAGG